MSNAVSKNSLSFYNEEINFAQMNRVDWEQVVIIVILLSEHLQQSCICATCAFQKKGQIALLATFRFLVFFKQMLKHHFMLGKATLLEFLSGLDTKRITWFCEDKGFFLQCNQAGRVILVRKYKQTMFFWKSFGPSAPIFTLYVQQLWLEICLHDLEFQI